MNQNIWMRIEIMLLSALFVSGGCTEHEAPPAVKVVKLPGPAATPLAPEDPRIRALQDLYYQMPDLMRDFSFPGDGVQLKNGKYHNEQIMASVELDHRSGRVAFGDLGGGSGQDAVAVLELDSGNSESPYLAAVLNTGGNYKNTSTVAVNWSSVRFVSILPGGKIEATGAAWGPNDPHCCPSQKVTQVFAVNNGTLQASGSPSVTLLSDATDKPVETNTNDAHLVAGSPVSMAESGAAVADSALAVVKDSTHRFTLKSVSLDTPMQTFVNDGGYECQQLSQDLPGFPPNYLCRLIHTIQWSQVGREFSTLAGFQTLWVNFYYFDGHMARMKVAFDTISDANEKTKLIDALTLKYGPPKSISNPKDIHWQSFMTELEWKGNIYLWENQDERMVFAPNSFRAQFGDGTKAFDVPILYLENKKTAEREFTEFAQATARVQQKQQNDQREAREAGRRKEQHDKNDM